MAAHVEVGRFSDAGASFGERQSNGANRSAGSIRERCTKRVRRNRPSFAFRSEAQDCEADAIVGLDFEVERIRFADVDGVPSRRIAATGTAVGQDAYRSFREGNPSPVHLSWASTCRAKMAQWRAAVRK
jgi:uncharacterized protein YbjQ (UPF0145 family)